MPLLRRRSKRDLTGSNLPEASVRHAAIDEAYLAWSRPFKQAKAAYARKRNAIVSTSIVRAMAPVVQKIRADCAQSALCAHADRSQLDAARKRSRALMAAALRKGVPGYAKLLRVRNEHLERQAAQVARKLAAYRRKPLTLSLDGLPTVEPVPIVTSAPYQFHDTHASPFDLDLLVFNESFVNPLTGILLTDIRFHHDEASWGFYNPNGTQQISTSVGAAIVVPQTGRITCTAVVENLFNRVFCAVTDNFGLSSSRLTFDVVLFIDVIHRGQSFGSQRLVAHNGLVSHGRELSKAFVDIPDHVPLTLRFTPNKIFSHGDRVDVLVGCLFRIESDTDDMEAFVTAQVMWRVHKFIVAMQGGDK